MPGKGERIWVVESDEYGRLDDEEVARMAVKVSTVVEMVGGTASQIADRVGLPDGTFYTERIIWRWHSFAPARQAEAELELVDQPGETAAAAPSDGQIAEAEAEAPPEEAEPAVEVIEQPEGDLEAEAERMLEPEPAAQG